MSYTPESQLLNDPIEAHIKTGDTVISAMFARLESADEWSDGHLDRIGEILVDLTAMQIRLRRLQSETK